MIIQKHAQFEKKSPIVQKFQDSGMELKPIYKKANMTRDNDDLLKPIERPEHVEEMNGQQSSQSLKERTERNLWRNEEVMEMLYIMQQVKALEKLNDKTIKSENVFKDVEEIMRRNGFIKKSHVQIWTKWKFLKSTYMTSRRNGVIPRIITPQVYEMIHQMITSHSQSMVDSCSSMDGDNSSASGMVISGVEGGVSNENEEDDSFGMAHPIFGFRLGMVKPEPEDTGYEPNDENASDNDPLEEESTPTKDENNDVETQASKEAQPLQQKSLEIPHRGRGRPPKYHPAANSTPNSTPSPAAMPPLRVAPFAKANNYTNNNIATRPPPPLTMPPAPRIRVANFSNLKDSNSVKFTQPKLIPKPPQRQNSPPVQASRIAKETNMQTRSSSTPSPSYPKMKQIPMRKTPYSLRPDRAIPDLDASLSPPPAPVIERLSNKKLEEVPTTKHLIMQSSSNNMQTANMRKRRHDWTDPMPNKLPKYNSCPEEQRDNSKSSNIEYDQNYGKVLQNVIIDLSSSLRKMQTDMMRDFFNKQNELLEREHKFQMQQDDMIMKAFQEQTQEIMHSVRQLVGSVKSRKNYQQNRRVQVRREAKPTRTVRTQQRRACQQVNRLQADEENDTEDEEDKGQHQAEDTEMEQDMTDMCTDDEQQQEQIEEQDENAEEEEQNDGNEEEEEDDEQNSQLSEEHSENEVSAHKTQYKKQLNED